MLNGQDPIHALKAEATLAIEEVGDVGLLETRLLCQAEAGEVAFLNALPKSIAEVVLQHSEFHRREYSIEDSNALINKRFPQPVGYNDLTVKIRSYTVVLAYNSFCFRRAIGHGQCG